MMNIHRVKFLSISAIYGCLITISYGMDEEHNRIELEGPVDQHIKVVNTLQDYNQFTNVHPRDAESYSPSGGNPLPTDLYTFMNAYPKLSSLWNPINFLETFQFNKDADPKYYPHEQVMCPK